MRRIEVAVIGAGVIGLAIALRLAAAGREVMLVDPAQPGSGASFGNAGTIADYAVRPVGSPEVLKALPRLLFSRASPFALRRSALPGLAPWLLRFLGQSLPGPARRNAAALAAILKDAAPLWRELAAEIGGTALLRDKGCLYLYERKRAFAAARAELAYRKGFGVVSELISAAEVAGLEPALPPVAGGAFFPGVLSLADPGRVMALLARAARGKGVALLARRVETIERRVDGVILAGAGLKLHARRVVIAAGAHSRGLARQAGDRIPLDTERGYHLEWDMATPRLSRPASPVARGFYLCPMAGRLRVAGTVELGGLAAPPSAHRIRRLAEGARAIFPDLGEPDRSWMGLRPSIPDSLPVIGPSKGGGEVILAFGHGHLGLTLAPATARIVADLLAGKPAPEATSPARFG